MTWWMWIAAGAMWMGFVALMIVLSLSGVDETVEAGLAQEPSDARVMVAVASSILQQTAAGSAQRAMDLEASSLHRLAGITSSPASVAQHTPHREGGRRERATQSASGT